MSKTRSQIGKASKNKGKVGEREVANLLKQYGFEARRGQQFSGTSDSPDVVHNIPGVLIEVKRREQLNLHDAMEKAKEECSDLHHPAIFHRKNGKPWLVTIPAEDYLSWERCIQALVKDYING